MTWLSPGNVNVDAPTRLPFVIASTCCATTESTGSSMRLNSSKQPHKPAWHNPLKILAMSV